MDKFVVIFFTLLLAISISACTTRQETMAVVINEPIKGVNLMPFSTPEEAANFLQKASSAGTAMTWAGTMDDFAKDQSAAGQLVSLAGRVGFTPIVITQIREADLNSDITKENYKKAIGDFVRKYRPKYFGLGNEVNKLPKDKFDQYMEFYDEMYDVIKTNSPDTKVFTVFQLEGMKGLNGGLFGGTNDPEAAQWSLLNRAKKYDIIAFTTYPGLIYKDPAEIPEDYYTEIKTKIFRPIAFSEIGWFKRGPIGWESSEEEQAAFIFRFSNLTQDVRSEFNIWPFIYDPVAQVPFNSMGLVGNTTVAWDAWKSI